MNTPKIVCLCGSTKFKEDFLAIQKEETLKGHIVFNRRLREEYKDINIERTNHNVVDAIGIGCWWIKTYGANK